MNRQKGRDQRVIESVLYLLDRLAGVKGAADAVSEVRVRRSPDPPTGVRGLDRQIEIWDPQALYDVFGGSAKLLVDQALFDLLRYSPDQDHEAGVNLYNIKAPRFELSDFNSAAAVWPIEQYHVAISKAETSTGHSVPLLSWRPDPKVYGYHNDHDIVLSQQVRDRLEDEGDAPEIGKMDTFAFRKIFTSERGVQALVQVTFAEYGLDKGYELYSREIGFFAPIEVMDDKGNIVTDPRSSGQARFTPQARRTAAR